MDEQKKAFLAVEADQYWIRNAEALDKHRAAALSDPAADPTLKVLEKLRPATILEVGAANGWRLDVAHQRWGAICTGVEPSTNAVNDGSRFKGITLHVGTAESLPPGKFDCVIFGFCLCWCDREDLFQIAASADRALNDGGYLVIADFFVQAPYRNPYSHRPGLYSFKMDHSVLWRWNLSYALWSHEVTAHKGKNPDDPDERLAVTVLKKFSGS